MVRFEDLVGPMGGGSLESQLKTLKLIAEHVGMIIEDEKLLKIAKRIYYKKSRTYRRGEIGGWKETFDDEIKTLFKKEHGELLVNLGYEIDFNW
jgi:hypothetical protein